MGVPNILGYLEWGCKISRGAKYPVTPGQRSCYYTFRFKCIIVGVCLMAVTLWQQFEYYYY